MLTAGVVARVLLPLVWPTAYTLAVTAAQALWAAAFAVFVVGHSAMLIGPRIDGANG